MEPQSSRLFHKNIFFQTELVHPSQHLHTVFLDLFLSPIVPVFFELFHLTAKRKFEIFTAVTVSVLVLQLVKPCGLARKYRTFGEELWMLHALLIELF
jgi:hypothetical protein